jgi:hypothetical protein
MLLQLSSPLQAQSKKACFFTFNPDEHPDFRASTIAEIQSWAPIGEEMEEILNVSKLRIMLGDKHDGDPYYEHRC